MASPLMRFKARVDLILIYHNMKIDLQVPGATQEQIVKYTEIFKLLIEKGALDGVRAGSTIIHFDSNCVFQGIEFSYFPWRRQKN